MKPLKSTEELAKMQQENLSAAIRFAQLTQEASQKLLGVQLDAARQTAFDEMTRTSAVLCTTALVARPACARHLC